MLKKKMIYVPLVAAMTVFFVVAAGAVAFAVDTLLSDGVISTTPVSNEDLAFGNVCPGKTYPDPSAANVALAIHNGNNENQTFENGASVAVSLGSISYPAGQAAANGTLSAPSSAGTITLPSNWVTSATGTLSDSVSTTVTLTVGSSATAGSYSGTVQFSATGDQYNSTAALSRNHDEAVTWTVLSSTNAACVSAPTNNPPVVTVTGVTNGANYEHGSVPAASCSVSDTEDGTPTIAPVIDPVIGPLSAFGLGSQTVTCSYTDNGGLSDSDSVTYNIVDTTAPVIAAHGDETAEATSAAGAIVNYTAPSATDAVDPAVAVTCVPASGSQFALGDTTVTCNATDAAGNAATATTFTVHVVDTTPPTITFDHNDPAANGNGWNNSDVTVYWSCTDLVGVVSATVSQGVTTEGANQAVTGTCEDTSGLTASDTQYISIDKTAPTVAYTSQSPAANGAGWNNTDVVATFTATDTLSGFAGPSSTQTGTNTSSGEGAAVSVDSPEFTDLAGNTVLTGAASQSFKIDKTAPTLTWNAGPVDGNSYYFGFVPAAPTCTAADTLSGPNGCTVTGYGTSVGSHTMTATAKDVADNSHSETRSFTVLAWSLYGFYAPVDMGGALNTVKGGSTVPLKFEVFAGPTELTDVSVVDTFVTRLVSCATLDTTDVEPIEVTTTGGTSLRYDTTDGQFIQNWKTPKTPGVCYVVTMATDDGSSISANFKLK